MYFPRRKIVHSAALLAPFISLGIEKRRLFSTLWSLEVWYQQRSMSFDMIYLIDMQRPYQSSSCNADGAGASIRVGGFD